MTVIDPTAKHIPTLRDAEIINVDGSSVKRSNALSSRLTNVLSSSYADSEIRDALRLLDSQYDDADLEREIDVKYDTQKKVIQANAGIIDDFSKVAQVRVRKEGHIA